LKQFRKTEKRKRKKEIEKEEKARGKPSGLFPEPAQGPPGINSRKGTPLSTSSR
jgi:hypothetical protein